MCNISDFVYNDRYIFFKSYCSRDFLNKVTCMIHLTYFQQPKYS